MEATAKATRTAETATEWRGEEYKPTDGKPRCNECNSMRFVISPKGELKPCPACNKYSYSKWHDKREASDERDAD